MKRRQKYPPLASKLDEIKMEMGMSQNVFQAGCMASTTPISEVHQVWKVQDAILSDLKDMCLSRILDTVQFSCTAGSVAVCTGVRPQTGGKYVSFEG